MNLEEYNEKRNFGKTAEPEGKPEISGDKLRYVIQHHIASREHYDLRLEWNGRLLSWAVPKGPSLNPQDKRLAIQVEDHPLEYRHFEGIIPKDQYGGGTVMLWDEGFWEPLTNVKREYYGSGSTLKFILHGKRLQGKWVLVKTKYDDNKRINQWLLIKEADEFAKSDAGIEGFTISIRSGKTMAEIENQVK